MALGGDALKTPNDLLRSVFLRLPEYVEHDGYAVFDSVLGFRGIIYLKNGETINSDEVFEMISECKTKKIDELCEQCAKLAS